MKLPNDVARCTNKDCSLKENCLRWLDKGEGFVWHENFKPKNNKCKYKIYAK